MKKIILFVLMLPGFAYGQICTFEWNASQSAFVTSYNLYRDKVKIKEKIPGLTTDIECKAGEYAVSAVNKFDIESALSEAFLISQPEAPTNLKAGLSQNQ